MAAVAVAAILTAASLQDALGLPSADAPGDGLETLARLERSLGPFEDACQELRRFRDQFELTQEEEKFLMDRAVQSPVVLMRMITHEFSDVAENVTTMGMAEHDDAIAQIETGLKSDAIVGFDNLVEEVYFPEIVYVGMDSENRSLVQFNVLLVAKGRGQDIVDGLSRNFTKNGVIGDLSMNYIFRKAYAAQIPKHTVYEVYLRLRDLFYMPMYTDLSNTATLKITNELLLTTRPLFRNRFGEYFIRGVVQEYHEGSVMKDTIVNMAFLLEAEDNNFREVDDIWAVHTKGDGALGNHAVTEEDFFVTEVNFIQEAYEQYLVADVTREELQLSASEFIKEIAMPSLGGMLLLMLFVLLCSWEGFCCRRCIEGEKGTGCLCCDFAAGYDHRYGYDQHEDEYP